MKTKLLLTAFLGGILNVNAQSLIIDSLFGVNGIHNIPFLYTEQPVQFLVQPDGKIITGGYSSGPNLENYTALSRFDICGTPDSSFAGTGSMLHSYDFRNITRSLALQPDGKIVCAGISATSNAGSAHIPFVSRYNNDGSPDTTFGTAGYRPQRFDPVSSGGFYATYLYPDNRILAIGRSTGNINGGTLGYGAMRFLPDGSLDLTFDGDGIVRHAPPQFSLKEVRGLLMPDERILCAFSNVAGGTFTESFGAAMLDSTGALDSAFGISGLFSDTVLLSKEVYPGLLSNQKILLAGTGASNINIELICLLSQGIPNIAFGTNGRISYPFPGGITGEVKGVRIIDSTFIYVVGQYNVSSGQGFILTLLPNGSVDPNFGMSGFLTINAVPGVSHVFEDITKLDNGQLLVAVNNTSDFNITRLIAVSNVPHITMNGTQLTTSGGYFFQWYFDSTAVPGATTNEYTPLQNGTYNVLVTDSTGCDYFSDPYILTNVGVSVTAQMVELRINNPVNEILQMTLAGGIIDEFKIYNVIGQQVLHEKINSETFSGRIILNAGVYFVHVDTHMGLLIRKLVKH